MIALKLAALQVVKSDNLPHTTADSTTLGKILTLVFVVIGSLSLLMLMVAAFRYVISGGNEEKVATAKRMIIYTLVGIIVSASAAIIVNTVLGQVKS